MFEDLRRGWGLYLKTLPFVYLRLKQYGIFGSGFFVYIVIACLGVYLFENGYLFYVALSVAGLGGYGLYQYYYRRVISRTSVRQLAVVLALIQGNHVPFGKRQLQFGKKLVLKNKIQSFRFKKMRVNPRNEEAKQLSWGLHGIGWSIFIGIFISLVPPTYGVAALLPSWMTHFFIFSALIAWLLKKSLVDSFAEIVMLVTYDQAIRAA